jgi:hypothetical protein
VLSSLTSPTAIALLTVVPEPASLALSCVGLLALAAGRARRVFADSSCHDHVTIR